MKTKLSNFNQHPHFSCQLLNPERYQDFTPQRPSCIARGNGLSYSDAAINENGIVILTTRLNRFLKFDQNTGILIAEAGITLHEISDIIVPTGWFLPVIPGSAQVTLGGAIASDVHGKNHFHAGSFSQHLLWLEIITAKRDLIQCSLNENTALFLATIGGMGLTGLISTACLQLKRIESPFMFVQTETCSNLEETLTRLNERAITHEYCVAWLAHSSMRSVILSARHVLANENIQKKPFVKKAISLKSPIKLINRFSVSLFNQLYYAIKKMRKKEAYLPYQHYFYPLEKIQHWSSFYGKKGFIQYQCVFPLANAVKGIQKLLTLFEQKKLLCSLISLKKLGNANSAPLSFPTEGITIAIDIPFSKNMLAVLDQADNLVLEENGRIYLAKDTRLTKPNFYRMYPKCLAWISIKRQIDPENIFQSELSKRLLS